MENQLIKYNLIIIIIFLAVFLFSNNVFAHSGRTDSSGGHNCRTGSCAGTYHYHNGGPAYTPPPTPKYIPPTTPTPAIAPIKPIAPTVPKNSFSSTPSASMPAEATPQSKSTDNGSFWVGLFWGALGIGGVTWYLNKKKKA